MEIGMISAEAIAYLAALPYRADAARQSSILPLGGIYWEDEIPDFGALSQLPEAARDEVFRLFSIRFKIWCGEPLSHDDDTYWSTVRSAVPGYGVFHRTSLSPEDRSEQEATEKQALKFFEELAANSDFRITGTGNGSISWRASLPVHVPWWTRLWRWVRRRPGR